MRDFSIAIDDHRAARGAVEWLLAAEHVVRLDGLAAHVAQQIVGNLERLSKSLVAKGVIAIDSKNDCSVAAGDLVHRRAKAAMLIGADWAEIHRIKQQHDFLFAAIVRQLYFFLILVHQLKIRCDVADVHDRFSVGFCVVSGRTG